MESVQFFSFGKVEGNSRDNGQKSQTGEDTFSDIMEQSLGSKPSAALPVRRK